MWFCVSPRISRSVPRRNQTKQHIQYSDSEAGALASRINSSAMTKLMGISQSGAL